MDKLLSFFTSISLIITYLFGFGTVTATDGYVMTSQQKLNSINSLASAQGICCDGDYFYCSGAISAINISGLAKYDTDMKKIKLHLNPIPRDFTKQYGSDHIGGIDCANGVIYGAVEGKLDGEYKYNLVLLFDCETLEYTGKFYIIDNEEMTDGIPWVAVDGEKGILYTSRYKGVNKIYCYNLSDMSYAGEIVLSETVNRIQGASVYNGCIYLSRDENNSTTEQIYRVDLSDGTVSLEFERSVPNYDNEAEDVAVYPLSDGSLFHIVDYDKLINVNIRHFKQP